MAKKVQPIVLVLALIGVWPPGVARAQQPKATALDLLKAADIPIQERLSFQPKELVAVYGSHAWHYWHYPWPGTVLAHLTTDGKRVTVHYRGWPGDTARIYDAATHKDQAVFRLPKDIPMAGAGYSLAGKLVALCQQAGFDWSATVFDAASKKQRSRVAGKGAAPREVFFSPNGKLLAYSLQGVQFFDLATGKHLFTAPQGYASTPLFHPNSTRVYYYTVSYDEDTKRHTTRYYEFDLLKRQERMLIQKPGYAVYGADLGQAAAMAVAPDGRWFAMALFPNDPKETSYVQLWNTAEHKPGVKIPCAPVSSLAFSPDNKSLAVGLAGGKVQFVERGSGKEIRSFEAGGTQLHNFAFSPDGKFLAAASVPDQYALVAPAQLHLWESATGKPVHQTTERARILAASPNGERLLIDATTGPGPGVYLLDLSKGTRLAVEFSKSWKVASVVKGTFSPDGSTLALITWVPGARVVQLIDTATGKHIPSKSGTLWGGASGETHFLGFTADGKSLVAAGGAQYLVSELDTGKSKLIKKVWSFIDAALSADGKILVADTNENIKMIDLVSGEIVRSLDRESPGLIAISPDGTKIGHAAGGAVQIWESKTGDVLYDLKGHLQPISGLCFDKNGNTLFTCGQDGRIIRWTNANSKREWRLPGPIRGIQLCPEGRHLFVNNSNGTAYVLRVEELE